MSENPYHTHVLEPGEDIFLLAELYYGDAAAWWIIYHANLNEIGDDPESLAPGTSIRIPFAETAEESVKMPAYVPATAFTNSEDPLIQFARDRYGDRSMAFDIREASGFTDDQVIAEDMTLKLPSRGDPKNLKKAKLWREKFGRRWVNGG